MFDKVRIGSLLDRIENSILLIQSKSGEINCPDDFLLSQDGMFILSGICMQLVLLEKVSRLLIIKLIIVIYKIYRYTLDCYYGIKGYYSS